MTVGVKEWQFTSDVDGRLRLILGAVLFRWKSTSRTAAISAYDK